jgi:hypothetical protein
MSQGYRWSELLSLFQISETGQQLKKEGMKRVRESDPAWADQANVWLRAIFKKLPKGHIFTTEELRLGCEDQGLPAPHHPNAWGSVMGAFCREMVGDGAIRHTGYESATRPEAHGRMMRVYKKL